MQLTITIPKSIEPALKALALQSGQKESEVATSLLLSCLSPKHSFGKGWQQMYDALDYFEPDFVLQREKDPEQLRQELI